MALDYSLIFSPLLFPFLRIVFWTFEANCTKSFWGQVLDIFDIFWYNESHKGVVCTLCGKVNIMALGVWLCLK